MGDSRSISGSQIVDPSEIMSESEIRQDGIITRKIAFPNHLDGIKWCVRRKLLKNNSSCENCNIPMTFIRSKRSIADGYTWGCRKCKKTRSLRKGSVFEGSHLTLSQILIIMYGWASERSQEYVAREAECSRSSPTVSEWYNFCREVCENYFIQNKIVIGGQNEDGTSKIVEIYDSKYFYVKYHRGGWIDGHWVFGGIERQTKKCFLVEVPDHTEATLAGIIERYCYGSIALIIEPLACNFVV